MSRAAAVAALAVGMCKGDGCRCPVGPPGGRWCIAESVYGSWAEAAMAEVERRGYVFMPTRPTQDPPRRRRHPETGRALAIALEAAAEAVGESAGEAAANDAGSPDEPPETVLFAEFGPFGTENGHRAPSAAFHDPGAPDLPPKAV